MRVLIYSYNYHPEPLGIAPLMTELAEGLVRRGHQVRVITGMPNYPQRQIYADYRGKLYCQEQRHGVQIQRSYLWARPNPCLGDRILLDLSFVCTSFIATLMGTGLGQPLGTDRCNPAPDIILITSPPLPVVLPATLLGRLYHCPLVLNLQDILPDAAVQLGLLRSAGLIRLLCCLESLAYRRASAISILSPKFHDNLTRKGVNPNKLYCIPNWIDLDFIKPNRDARQAVRQRLHLEDEFIALYSGNIAHSQGLETLLQAAAQLQHLPKLVILIVGETQAIAQLQQWGKAQGLSQKNLRFLPLQPRAQLPGLLAASDVGLVIQRRPVTDFNMPSKTQMLMAAALPIVASVHAQSAVAEVLTQSQGGPRVEPENAAALAGAIAQLYHHPAQAQAMGQRNRALAEAEFGLDQALDAYESLFLALARSPEPHPKALAAHSDQTPAQTPTQTPTQTIP